MQTQLGTKPYIEKVLRGISDMEELNKITFDKKGKPITKNFTMNSTNGSHYFNKRVARTLRDIYDVALRRDSNEDIEPELQNPPRSTRLNVFNDNTSADSRNTTTNVNISNRNGNDNISSRMGLNHANKQDMCNSSTFIEDGRRKNQNQNQNRNRNKRGLRNNRRNDIDLE